jgi:enoyl-CoA hydratase
MEEAMESNDLLFEKKEDIGVLTINRPKQLNALTRELLHKMEHLLQEKEVEKDVKALIIRGAGGKAFSSGDDIYAVSQFTPSEFAAILNLGQKVFRHICYYDKVIIACIEGYALGGGLELALACDFRIADEQSIFGFPEIALGITPGWGGTQRLPRIVGEGRAKELVLTCDYINAQEAYRIGLVNKVVPKERLLDEAVAMARKVVSKGPIAVKYAKRLLNESFNAHQSVGLECEVAYTQYCKSTEDFKEGLRAFMEKRTPQFKGE